MDNKNLNSPAILNVRAMLAMQRAGKEKETHFFEQSVKKAIADLKKSAKSDSLEEMVFTTMLVAEITLAVNNGEFL